MSLKAEPALTKPVLWTAEEVQVITGGRWETPPEVGLGYSKVECRHRQITPGCLFFTRNPRHWKYYKYDEPNHIKQYVRKGAVTVVVERVPNNWDGRVPLLVVDNTRKALFALATAGRSRFRGTVIAITGTVGKTTTKEILRQGLSSQATVVGSGNRHSNQTGIAITLMNLLPDADYAVIEVGLGGGEGVIRKRVAYVRPHIAVITDVGYDHLRKYRRNLTAVAYEKADIMTAMDGEGTVVINRDTPAFCTLKETAQRLGVANIVTAGWSEEADSRLIDIVYENDHTTRATASILGEPISYRLNWIGRPPAFCAMLALTVVRLLGADWRNMAKILTTIDPPPERMERFKVAIPGGSVVVFNDNYNASPKSVVACFETASMVKIPQGSRRIAVLSDMAGMGGLSDQLHEGLAEPFKKARFDMLFTWGEKMLLLRRALGEAVPPGGHFDTVKAMAMAVLQAVQPGDVIFLKGSVQDPEVSPLDQVLFAIQVYGFTGRRIMF